MKPICYISTGIILFGSLATFLYKKYKNKLTKKTQKEITNLEKNTELEYKVETIDTNTETNILKSDSESESDCEMD